MEDKKKLKWHGRQVTALKGSIGKWKGIVTGTTRDYVSVNCKCCNFYIEDGCKSCPVAIFTGITYCGDTPWKDWCAYWSDRKDGDILMPTEGKTATTPEEKELAQAEVDFLKKVLAAGV